jgi:hypothetical protein
MVNPRALHTSTVLANGTLLVAGGCGTATCDISLPDARATAEIIDLVAGSTSATTPMNAAHVGATGTLLGSGKVLIAGGATSAGGNGTDFAEIFSAGTFSCPGTTCVARTPMGTPRNGHGALLLPNGQVALFGGKTTAGAITATIELFNPAGNGTFTANAASLGTGRWLLQATQLGGGRPDSDLRRIHRGDHDRIDGSQPLRCFWDHADSRHWYRSAHNGARWTHGHAAVRWNRPDERRHGEHCVRGALLVRAVAWRSGNSRERASERAPRTFFN